jgi:hypothetical protein
MAFLSLVVTSKHSSYFADVPEIHVLKGLATSARALGAGSSPNAQTFSSG